MSKIGNFISSHAETVRDAFRYGPLEAVLGVVVAISFSVAVGLDDGDTWEWWARLSMSSALLLPALLSVSMAAICGKLGTTARGGASAVLVVAAALYGLFGIDPDREVTIWRWGLLVPAFWSAFLLAPLVARRPDDAARAWFWTVNHRLIARFTVVMLFTGALYLGLAAALAAIDALFDIGFREDPYMHLFGAAFYWLVPSLVVGGLPEILEPVGQEPVRAPRIVRWVGAYLIVPLLLVYVAILYAYNVKVLGASELPQNALSPLALGAAAFGLIGVLLTDPLQAEDEPPLSVRLLRYFPAYFIALVPLAAWAILLRVDQYGWTEFRYVRMLALVGATVFCLLGIARLFRRAQAPITAIPATFALLFLIAAVGPFSASAVGKRSQSARLLANLERAGLLTEDGRLATERTFVDDAPPTPGGERGAGSQLSGSIYGAANYLEDRWGEAYLEELLGFESEEQTVLVALSDMGIEPWYGWGYEGEITHADLRLEYGVTIPNVPAGAQTAFRSWSSDWTPVGEFEVRSSPSRLEMRSTDNAERICVFDVSGFAVGGLERHARQSATGWESVSLDPTAVLLPGRWSDGTPCGSVLIESISGPVHDYEGDDARFEELQIEGRWIR